MYYNGKHDRIISPHSKFYDRAFESQAISMPIRSHRQKRSLNLSLPLHEILLKKRMLNMFNIWTRPHLIDLILSPFTRIRP